MQSDLVEEGVLNLHGMLITIPKDKDLVFGRSATCDVVLQHELVSKQHARFYFSLGRYFVEDLKSANGTRVNKERINGARGMVSFDEVTIYPYRIIFMIQQVDPNAQADGQGGDVDASGRSIHFSGRIDVLSIADLIQLLNSTIQTGILTVTDRDGQKAILALMEGEIVAANYLGLEGIDAVYELVKQNHGEFQFERKKIGMPKDPMTCSTVTLLFEACRLKDEGASRRNMETVALRRVDDV